MNEVIAILNSLSSATTTISQLINQLPKTFLPDNKTTLEEIRSKTQEQSDQVSKLRNAINNSNSLIISYSDALLETESAYRPANKLAELYRHVGKLFLPMKSLFLTNTQEELSNLKYKVAHLPPVDATTLGVLNERIDRASSKVQTISHIINQSPQPPDCATILSKHYAELAEEYLAIKNALRQHLNTLIIQA